MLWYMPLYTNNITSIPSPGTLISYISILSMKAPLLQNGLTKAPAIIAARVMK